MKGKRERLLTAAFMIRVIVLMTLLPGTGVREAVTALAGDLGMVPWSRPWEAASERAARGLAERARPGAAGGTAGHRAAARHGRSMRTGTGGAVAVGREQAAEGGVAGRDGDPGPGHAGEPRHVRFRRQRAMIPRPFPCLRALPLNDVSTPVAAGMPPARPARTRPPRSRNCWMRRSGLVPAPVHAGPDLAHGPALAWTARIARLIGRTHVLIRVKSDITLKKIRPVLADGSYLAELSGNGVTIAVRVIEYFVLGARWCRRCSAWSPTCWTPRNIPPRNSRPCISGGGTGRSAPRGAVVTDGGERPSIALPS